ncbi:MAG TPA: peptidylprolyl isomerase [Ilumatobacteraceae bacterium]|nr:peptidylprolyl isomerase [Ilumatobacteraceae bacterium]
MGTPKRERQKANRQQRLEELARQARTEKRKRNGMYLLLIPVGALVLIGLIKLVGGGSDDAASATTIDPLLGSTTTIDPNLPTTTLTPLPSTVAGATLTGETPCPAADGSSPRTITFAQAPPSCIDATKTYSAEVTTNKGAYTIELDAGAAPLTVNNFVVLARYHYFDSTICHRAIPQFAVQCGDPTGTGSGGPGYTFADELPAAGSYKVGSIAMANSGPDTNGSQFFIITGANGVALSPDYTLFGQVTDGLDTTVTALDALGNPDQAANGVPPLEQIVIQSVTITEA